jgi:hypothetical protein
MAETKEQVDRIVGVAGKALEAGQLVSDVLVPVRDVLIGTPANALTSEQWDHLYGTIQALHSAAKDTESSLTMVNTFYATAYAVTSTSSSAVSLIHMAPLDYTPGVERARSRLNRIFERTPLLEKVRGEMARLGLDQAHPFRKSPVELIGEAAAALQRPVGSVSPAAVLIPIRESINASLEELVRRQRTQESVPKRERFVSLGRQCGLEKLNDLHFERLANDREVLIDQLSASKQATLTREQIVELFNRTLTFLIALLGSIDETKLRR